MESMLAFLNANRSKKLTVIIDDLSRLARGLEQHLALRSAINDTGAQLASPSIEFGEDPDSILVENLLASVAQHHKQKNGTQSKSRSISRMMNGYCVHPQPPVGYVYKSKPNIPGKVLVRDEPLASIVKEALDGYASGRFQSKAEIVRFLETFPEFPRDKHGNVRNQRVQDILTHSLYPGFVESVPWKISRRKGQHEPIIDVKTHLKIKKRLSANPRVPKRRNTSKTYPLRGFVLSHECSRPMTGSTSRGRSKKYDYYHCFNNDCADQNKTVHRLDMHKEFEALLDQLKPPQQVIDVFAAMLRDSWEALSMNQEVRSRHLKKDIEQIDKDLDGFMARIVEANSATVIKALERKIEALEDERRLKEETMSKLATKRSPFESVFRTALVFLENPRYAWDS